VFSAGTLAAALPLVYVTLVDEIIPRLDSVKHSDPYLISIHYLLEGYTKIHKALCHIVLYILKFVATAVLGESPHCVSRFDAVLIS